MLYRALLALAFVCCASTAAAQVVVPTGSSIALGGGTLDLAGSALQVGGLFSLASGKIDNATNIGILAGGTIDGGSGQIQLTGDWANAGNFVGGSSTVDFLDPGSASQIGGDTSFANLSFASSIGKSYVFAAGSTQTVAGLLTIAGITGLPIQFRSSAAGQIANINLLAGGSQNISHVGVSDVHATGQHLAPSLSNEGGSGNATGWFAAIVPTIAVPADMLSPIGLLLFALVMLAGVWLTRRQQFEY
jgi:hypothetical protein